MLPRKCSIPVVENEAESEEMIWRRLYNLLCELQRQGMEGRIRYRREDLDADRLDAALKEADREAPMTFMEFIRALL